MHHQSKTTHNTAMTNEDYMNEELEALAVMTEEEACRVYNVDFKAEAEIYIVHSIKQKNMMTKLFRSQMRQVMTDAGDIGLREKVSLRALNGLGRF